MRIRIGYPLAVILLSSLYAQSELRDDSRSNEYIHEDWSFFARRLHNEHLAQAEQRFSAGDFQAAILDYFKFLYLFPDDEMLPLVQYRIGRAYEEMGNYTLAREKYRLVLNNPGSDPQVKRVCVRQIARMDYESGDFQAVLEMPARDDPYMWLVRGYSHLAINDWATAAVEVRQAYPYFPPDGKTLLDRLLAGIDTTSQLKIYKQPLMIMTNIVPGGGRAYLGRSLEAASHFIATASLLLAALTIDNWTRYLFGIGALTLYVSNYWVLSKQVESKNRELIEEHLDALQRDYPLSRFWRFAHPSIY